MNNYFEFNSGAKILCGEDALNNLDYELEFFQAKNPLLLSDEGIVNAGLVAIVKQSVKAVKMETEFFKIPADSSTITINQIARLYKNNKCDAIIAVGGGSVIDTAKGVKLLLSQDCENILELSGNEIVKKGHLIPFIVIPTTCGTGSECTAVAVIKDAKTKTKLEFISSELLPDVALLDPRMIKNLPPKIMASTAIDALTHSIEAYSGLQKNALSDAYSTLAVKLISDNLLEALNGNEQSKAGLLLASNIAGTAFSNSMVGIVHAIGHALGAVAGVPHGCAMAILLPECLKFNLDYNYVEYSKLLLYFTNEDTFAYTKPNERGKLFIEKIEEFLKNVKEKSNLMLKLSDYGVQEKDLIEISEKAINDGASIINSKPFNRDDVLEILKAVF